MKSPGQPTSLPAPPFILATLSAGSHWSISADRQGYSPLRPDPTLLPLLPLPLHSRLLFYCWPDPPSELGLLLPLSWLVKVRVGMLREESRQSRVCQDLGLLQGFAIRTLRWHDVDGCSFRLYG